MSKVDVKNLTTEETIEMAEECLGFLSLKDRITVVMKTFTSIGDMEELKECLEEEIEEQQAVEEGEEEDET